MNQTKTTDYHYRVGGSLAHNHPTYVERRADEELFSALKAGKFCYVFNCRQMGKSSLRVRCMHRLQAEGMNCASVDVTSLGSDITLSQWYSGVITQLFLGFNLTGQINLKAWLKEREELPPVQKLGQFIEEVILLKCQGEKVFIFIDEIDKVLSLKFSLDDFFSLIRFCYNQRAENPLYNRLSFALFGVATPSDLIREKTQTSFNIGQAIELTGFTAEEIAPLAVGLSGKANNPQSILKEILHWTGGQPFLTQKICQMIVQYPGFIEEGEEKETIHKIVFSHLIENWESQDEPVHLKTIRDRLLRNEQKAGRLLGMYKHILEQGFIEVDDSPEQVELRLSGLVVKRGGKLVVYNPIYELVFNKKWINKQLEKLRPYSESLAAWTASDFKDESRLLRGQALKDALVWAMGKGLSNLDYQFLTASQKLDKREAEINLEAQKKANQILSDAHRKAKQRIRIGSAILIISMIGALAALAQAKYQSDRQMKAQIGTQLQRGGDNAWRQFQFQEIDALISAMKTTQQLKTLVKKDDYLQNYPATSPIISLEQILDKISEKNQLKGHQDTVYSVAFSSDGKYLATASRDKTVKIWKQNGNLETTLRGHEGAIYSVSFSPDGKYLATASKDNTVKLWNLRGEEIATFRGHEGSVYNLTFSPDGTKIASTSRDNTIRLWDLKGTQLVIFKGHKKSVDDVSFSPDGKQIATASRDGTVRIWDLQGNQLAIFKHNNASFYSVSFSPKGNRIAAAGSDGTVKIWDLQGNLLSTLEGHQDFVNSVNFSPNGQWLATASSDGTTKIWDEQGRELLTLKGHQDVVYDVAWNGKYEQLATASGDGTIKLWYVNPKSISENKNLNRGLNSVSFSLNNNLIAKASKDGEIYISNLSGDVVDKFASDLDRIYELSFSPDGNQIGAVSREGTIKIWNPEGKILKQWQGDSAPIYRLTFNPQENKLATASGNGLISIWNLGAEPSQLVTKFSTEQETINHLEFSPDGKTLAIASSDGVVKIWDSKTNVIKDLIEHQDEVYWLSFSPDGKSLVTASADGSAKLWNTEGKELAKLQIQGDLFPVYRVTFSSNGEYIATASGDGTARLWDIQGNLRAEFRGDEDPIYGISFTSNNKKIITVAQDGMVRQWEVKEEFARLEELLQQGCDWLNDYLLIHPEERENLDFCSSNFLAK